MEFHNNVDVWLRFSPSTAVSQMAAIRCEQMENRSPRPSERSRTHVENGAIQSSLKKCLVKSQNAAVQLPKSSVPLQTNKSMSDTDTTTLKLPLEKSAEPFVQSESRGHILDGHTVIGEPSCTMTKYMQSL